MNLNINPLFEWIETSIDLDRDRLDYLYGVVSDECLDEDSSTNKTLLSGTNKSLRPYKYGWAAIAALKQNQSHWLPEEVELGLDLGQWEDLSEKTKIFLTHLFRFFTQTELEVNKCYIKKYMGIFNYPEIIMMLSAFSNMETIHTLAYSYLIDELGMSELEYKKFRKYKEITDQHSYINGFFCDNRDPEQTALTMAVFAAFTEGLHLFVGFVMLLHFQTKNIMRGMCQIVTWASRDEALHVESIILMYKTILSEDGDRIDIVKHRKDLLRICKKMVDLEDRFVDLCFGVHDEIEGLPKEKVKQYTRFLADFRMNQLGCDAVYNIKEDPLPEITTLLLSLEHANFFENRATEYSKCAMSGNWSDAFNSNECDSCQ